MANGTGRIPEVIVNVPITPDPRSHTEAQGDDLQAALGKITARIPNFWPASPELWFLQLEAQFSLSNIRSELTKYRWVVGNLDAKYANEVIDLISTPPAENQYTAIRTALVSRLTQSRQVRLHQLLAGEELGDRRPSEFLRYLKSLDPEISEDIVKTLWIDRLPETVRAAIITQMTLPTEQLGQMADAIFDVVGGVRIAAISNHHVNAGIDNDPGQNNHNQIYSRPSVQTSYDYDPNLRRQVSELTKQVAALAANFKKHNRNSTQSQSRTRSHPENQPAERLCWFHFRFGNRARRCSEPCGWTGPDARNNQGNTQRNH